MKNSKFSKPPIIDKEKLEAFINLSDSVAVEKETPKQLKKEETKPVYLRAPKSLWEDIHEIMARTGLSMNAICLGLLRPEIKKKLKEVKEN